MSWLDLEEGVLEEFSVRSSTILESLGAEFAQRFVHTIVRVGSRHPAGHSNECACGEPTRMNSSTCSRRCTQSRRRKERAEMGVCIICGRLPAKKTAQQCIICAPEIDASERIANCTTRRCERTGCHNHVIVGLERDIKYCRSGCRTAQGSRRDRSSGGALLVADRVLVASCSSNDPEVRHIRVLFVGKRGRVVEIGEVITVQFYGGKRAQFHPGELLKLS
jgi:hypothetical protein